MASFKAKFPVLQELFAKNHRGGGGPFGPPPPAGRGLNINLGSILHFFQDRRLTHFLPFSSLVNLYGQPVQVF